MLKRLANAIMTGRARRIYRRVGGYLPESGTIADVGSGTGHNAEWIRDRTGLTVREFDVTDLHWVGPGPEVSRPGRLPLDDDSVAGVLLLYVLQYCDDPVGLLRETSRVTSGHVIVLQSVCDSQPARMAWRVREFFLGRFGVWIAGIFGLVSASPCFLTPVSCYSTRDVQSLVSESGMSVHIETRETSILPGPGRTLFVLSGSSL